MLNTNQHRASPLAKRFALAMGVNLEEVTGTGFSGKIMKSDVQNHLQKQNVEVELSRKRQCEPVPIRLSTIVDVEQAESYIARVNSRFPQMSVSLSDIAAKAFASAAPECVLKGLSKYCVENISALEARLVPADGKNRKLSELAKDCKAEFDPTFEMPKPDVAYLILKDFSERGESFLGKMLHVSFFAFVQAEDEYMAAAMLSRIKSFIEDPVALMI